MELLFLNFTVICSMLKMELFFFELCCDLLNANIVFLISTHINTCSCSSFSLYGVFHFMNMAQFIFLRIDIYLGCFQFLAVRMML